MNERVMQFRIGMFVIVAGLVLIMMIIWFGESPTILRDQVFLKVHYLEAPGVSDGIPVRRSGIKVGEVSDVAFDERDGQPDGVIVTLALDRKSKMKVGMVPMITRALIGDVAIELQPGSGTESQPVGDTPKAAPMIEGDVSPDPAKALGAASKAIEKVGGTLAAIEGAADGIKGLTRKLDKADELIATFTRAGGRVDDVLKSGQADVGPAIASIRSFAERANKSIDDATLAELKTAISRISAAGARLDAGLSDLKPLLADLGSPVNSSPTTNFGQTLWRANRVVSDINLLTRSLSDGKGGLNPNGTIQQLFVNTALYDNWTKVSTTANDLIVSLRPVVHSLRGFATRVEKDPGALTKGALSR